MATDEISPFEKPDELTAPDALSLLRSYASTQIRKKTREAMEPSQLDVSEGALPEPPPPPMQIPLDSVDPIQNPAEYKEEEA
tara:strand:+ start:864 stop:1109 length:246 start_codon:yes stop_codon:yes gene_type:complete